MSTAYEEKFSSILRCKRHKVEPVDRLASFYLIRIIITSQIVWSTGVTWGWWHQRNRSEPHVRSCENLLGPMRPWSLWILLNQISVWLQCDEMDVGAVLPAIRACAFVAGAVSVLNSSEWEGSRTCPFVLLSAGGIFVFSPILSGIQWQIAVYKPHGHDNNWLLYSESQSVTVSQKDC